MENKTIGIGALLLIIATLAFVGGVSIDDPDAYYCEDRNMVAACEGFGLYYGLDNGLCLVKDEGISNKVCRSGWVKIMPEFIQPEPEPVIIVEKLIDKVVPNQGKTCKPLIPGQVEICS